jgi:archaellum component FlaC
MGDDGRIYVFGGYEYNFSGWDSPSPFVMVYNLTTGMTTFATSMSSGVAWPSCAKLSDGRIAVIGGYDSAVMNSTSAVRILNPRTNVWTSNTSAPVNISRAATALGEDGKVYVFGPMNHQNMTLIYDPVNDSWSSGTDLPAGRARYGASAVTYNSTSIYVMGGSFFYYVQVFPGVWMPFYSDTNYVDIYDPTNDTWSTGPSLNHNKEFGGAAVDRLGRICYFGGQQFMGSVYDEIESLDPSSQGAGWQISSYKIAKGKSHFGTVRDDHASMFLVGGRAGSPTWAIVPDVEMIMAAEVSGVNEISITFPADQTNVSGVVEVMAELKNRHGLSPVIVDFYVDDVWMESQLGESATSWRFLWNASSEAEGSQHTLLVRCYFSDSSSSEDSVAVTVGPDDEAIEQRLASIEAELDAVSAALANISLQLQDLANDSANMSSAISGLDAQLQDMLADLSDLAAALSDLSQELDDINASIEADLGALSADIDSLSAQLGTLEATVNSLSTSIVALQTVLDAMVVEVRAALDELSQSVEENTQAIEDLKESTGGAETTSSSTEAYALAALAVSVIVLVLLVASMLMTRARNKSG